MFVCCTPLRSALLTFCIARSALLTFCIARSALLTFCIARSALLTFCIARSALLTFCIAVKVQQPSDLPFLLPKNGDATLPPWWHIYEALAFLKVKELSEGERLVFS